MRQLAVIPEPFAVIGGHDDRGRTRGSPGGVEQRAERLVDVGDLAVVQASGVLGVERRRRRIRRVRIEHVHPGEPAPLAAGDPFQRGVDHFARRALREREIGIVAGAAEAVVVDVEPAVQPEAPFERHAADEGARLEPLVLQHRRDRRHAGLQPVAAVIADAVLVGVGAGEDARMRRPGQRGVRVREVEPRAARRERVEVRRPRRAAVAAHRIRPQRVDGDEEDVLIGPAIERALRGAAGDRPHPDAQRQRRRGEDRRAPRPGEHDYWRASRSRAARAFALAGSAFSAAWYSVTAAALSPLRSNSAPSCRCTLVSDGTRDRISR